MASIYNGLLYNDDVDMGLDDLGLLPASSIAEIDDESQYFPPEPPEETVPAVIDIDATDSITRVLDGWTKDLSTEGGTAGEVYVDTPPVEKPENPPQQTKTIYSQTQTIINDYSASYLQTLVDAGARFYVVYTDGTSNEVTVNEIYDPHPSIDQTIQVETESIAKAINQHFWYDNNGAHVTDVPQDDWFDALEDEFLDWPETPYHNILMNSLGILLRTQLLNLASISRSGIAFFDGNGNAASNILASFGINGSVLRANGRDVLRVTPTGVVFVPLQGEEISVTMITDNINNLINTVESNKAEIDTALARIQDQIDGVVDTYYEEIDPEYEELLTDSYGYNVSDNSDENIDIQVLTPWMYEWTTEEIRALHEGDLYYNILTGHAWRWLKIDDEWQWYRIADSDVAQALQIARDANTLAGTKRRVFTTTPTVPYDIGDIWVTGSDIKYATVAKAVGSSYAASDWEQTATDDTLANTALNKANQAISDASDANEEITVIKRDYVTNATYEQNNRTWSANLSSLETSVKQYSDGLISTEVVNRNAAITAESNAVKQYASATYQSKGNYATTADLQNEVTARNSAIETRAGSILSTVSETYATQQELGTYISQTSDSITTIIGDLDSVQSVVYYQEERLNETEEDIQEKNNAYYGTASPVINGDIEDSFGEQVLDDEDEVVEYRALTAASEAYLWITDYARDKHVGDLYINTVNGYMWRYTDDYQWEYIEFEDAKEALSKIEAIEELDLPGSVSQARTDARNASQVATQASTLAGTKARTFTTTPTPPYNVGDIWVDGSTVRYCVIATISGDSYNASHWSLTATDDSSLNTYKDTIATIIREINSGVVVAKAGASIGTLQGSSNFQVVGIDSWSGSVPTIGATYALFGANGMSVYDNTGINEIAFFGVQNTLPFTRLGRVDKGNIQIGVNSDGYGSIDFFNNGSIMAHIGYGITNYRSSIDSSAIQPYYSFGSLYSEPISRPWTIDTNFYAGELISYNGEKYYCNVTHTARQGATPDNGQIGIVLYSKLGTSNYGSNSMSVGTSSAPGPYSIAGGYHSIAGGFCGIAHGYNAKSVGSGGYAFGDNAFATSNSFVAGSDVQVTTPMKFATVFGRLNSWNQNDLFEIGNGSSGSTTTRANAFRVTNSNTAYMGSTAVTSDKRIKTDLGILDQHESIEFVKSLIPHKYKKFGRKELGFFAQDVEKDQHYGDILVEQYEDHGYKDFRSLSYDGLLAPMVAAMQNIIERLEKIEKKLGLTD